MTYCYEHRPPGRRWLYERLRDGVASDEDITEAPAAGIVIPHRERMWPRSVHDAWVIVAQVACIAAEQATTPSFVYFLRQAEPPYRVKVGISRDPEARMMTLRIGSPSPLRLAGVCKGGPELERAIHAYLDRWWSHGEWFKASPDMDEVIGWLCTKER